MRFFNFGPGMVGSSGARLGRETRSQTGAPILNNIFSAGPNFDPNPDITHFNMWSCEVVNTNTVQFEVACSHILSLHHFSEMSKYPVLVTKWWPTIHHQSCWSVAVLAEDVFCVTIRSKGFRQQTQPISILVEKMAERFFHILAFWPYLDVNLSQLLFHKV